MLYAIVQQGVVVNIVVWDGTPYTPAVAPDDNGEGGSPATGWAPPEGTSAVLLPDESEAGIGWSYDGNTFTAPPPPVLTPAEILANNTATRDALSATATNQIAILSDATDPDIVDTVDPADVAKLKAWKQYRVALSKLDLTQAAPLWPPEPKI